MDNKEYNVVTLEDNNEYTEIGRLDNDGKTYVFLSNLENPDDFCIRKLIKEKDKEYIRGLDNKEEFDKMFKLFTKEFLN